MRTARLLAVAETQHRRRAADLNKWIDDAEDESARWRRVASARADEDLWIAIVLHQRHGYPPARFPDALEAARRAAWNAGKLICASMGGTPGHPDAEHQRGLIDLWRALLHSYPALDVPADQIPTFDGTLRHFATGAAA